MKILFDHQAFTMQKYGGISRYFYELIKRFGSSNNIVDLSLRFSNNLYLDKGMSTAFFPNTNFRGKQKVLNYINHSSSITKIRKSDFDIFHPTYYDAYFLKDLGNKPFVVTFLDMIHEKYTEKYSELAIDTVVYEYKAMLAKKASKIIAISESTKRDMVELMGINPDKIEVIHLGSSFDGSKASQSPYYDFSYLLFVGSRTLYKNFKFFLESISPVFSATGIKLVCAGGGNFNVEEQSLIEKLSLKDAVVYCDFDDALLANLYKYAIAFVFPTLYEGFGIPILEAFACGCPCLLSNTSSLPEVGGDAAIYFDPEDAESILQSVMTIIDNETLRKSLVNKGSKRLEGFSWDKMYDETVSLYKSII